jgi:hypothetical protein
MPTNTNLSTKPEHVRKRIRRANKTTRANMLMLANERKPLEEWDLEELARGRPRDKDGSFRGATPKWITPVIVEESKRRLHIQALATMGSMVGDAIQVVHRIMMNDDVDDNGKPIVDTKTRLQAAMFIIEHVMGKPKQRVDVETGSMWKSMLAGALKIQTDDGDYVDAHPVIDLADEEWTDDDDDE